MTAAPEPGASGFAWLGGESALGAASYGLKAAWLDRALRGGARVPDGFAIDATCLQRIGAGDADARAALEQLLAALRARPAPAAHELRVAVRSSAARSLPGALLTRLDVGCDGSSVLRALDDVLRSAEAPAVEAQLRACGEAAPRAPWVGAIVQRYLPPRAEGDFGAVAFTRDPHSGRPGLCGEYAPGGTPEVVSGRTRPEPLQDGAAPGALARRDARALAAIEALARNLEALFGEPLELELAWSAGELWLLQARALTLSPRALLRLAAEAIEDDSPGYPRWLEALAARGLDALAEQHFAAAPDKDALVLRGLPASPGVASGVLVTDVARALARAAHDPVVLMRTDAVPEDVAAFRAAQAVVTSSGGLTCHAAVIARGLRIPAVVGCAGARIDSARGQVFAARGGASGPLLAEGDWVSVDARAGLVYRGALPRETRIGDPELKQLFTEVRKLRSAPLWAAGDVDSALRVKEEACLDGALCRLAAGASLPPPRGRECWLELDVAELASFAALPAGWGVIVRGDLTGVSIAALRAAAPLRALGVSLDSPSAFLPAGRLDLVVVRANEAREPTCDGACEPSEAAQAGADELQRALIARIDAARLLFAVHFSDPPAVAPTKASKRALARASETISKRALARASETISKRALARANETISKRALARASERIWGLAALAGRDNVGWVYPASQAARAALRDAAWRRAARGT